MRATINVTIDQSDVTIDESKVTIDGRRLTLAARWGRPHPSGSRFRASLA